MARFLGCYEDRFLYILEEKEYLSELALCEEYALMCKFLASIPLHTPKTCYLLSMAFKTYNFLASVVLMDSRGIIFFFIS